MDFYTAIIAAGGGIIGAVLTYIVNIRNAKTTAMSASSDAAAQMIQQLLQTVDELRQDAKEDRERIRCLEAENKILRERVAELECRLQDKNEPRSTDCID